VNSDFVEHAQIVENQTEDICAVFYDI